MPRHQGSRDRHFAERRTSLIRLAREHLSHPDGRNASWRDLAAAAGVSTSTLAHYFGDREALVGAILDTARQEGEVYLAMAARPGGAFPGSIAELVRMIGEGLDRGVLALQVIGLTEGLSSRSSGEAYLGHHLEPMLGAIRARLDAHVTLGDMRPADTRVAAIGLLAPPVIARLHQSELGGQGLYPMDLAEFDTAHAEAFIRAYGA